MNYMKIAGYTDYCINRKVRFEVTSLTEQILLPSPSNTCLFLGSAIKLLVLTGVLTCFRSYELNDREAKRAKYELLVYAIITSKA